MNNHHTGNRPSQLGFTILELMISLFVGAFILAGVMFTFLGMKTTTSDTMQIGELQESGRLAMDVLKRDIELTGFWGSFVSTPHDNFLTDVNPTSPSPDCYEGSNNFSFPQLGAGGAFKVLFAKEAESQKELNCINDSISGSDILQVKHVVGNEVTENTSAKKTYFVATPQTASFRIGTGSKIIPPTNGSVWEYSHNVYFVAKQEYTLNGKKVDLPTLKRMRLVDNKMTSETIMEGVENIRFIFGLDNDGDARVDLYKPASHMHNSDWDQQGATVTSVQIFLLVRTLEPSSANPPGSQTFILGGEDEHKRTLTFNDGYRRKLLTSTVRLANVGNDKWAI
jgi:type IV pilus assembly protein PilW